MHPGLMTCDVSMIINGERDPKMFLKSLLNVILDSSIYSLSHFKLSHLYLSITPPLCVMLSLSPGATRTFLMMHTPLK